jgi:hypothetical protein
VPARVLAPGLGAVTACCDEEGEASPYLQPGDWLATVGFRYLHSFRDFHRSDDVPVPSPRPLYADTHVYGFIIGLAYQASERFSLSIELPVQYGNRNTYYEHDPFTFKHLHRMEASGIGDLRLVGGMWLLDPKKHYHGNISLGLGAKFPTGDYQASDLSYRPTGPIERPVDPAIQLGNGGWGIATQIDAFQKISKNMYAYLQGTYLIEPMDTNDAEYPTGDIRIPGFGKFNKLFRYQSVPDSYLGRGGVGIVLWPRYGLALTLGGRIEGLPAEDLIGSSSGAARTTGYSVYFEPGLTVSKGRYTFTVTGPVAVHRYVGTDAVIEAAAKKFHIPDSDIGFAALADYLITTSISIQF